MSNPTITSAKRLRQQHAIPAPAGVAPADITPADVAPSETATPAKRPAQSVDGAEPPAAPPSGRAAGANQSAPAAGPPVLRLNKDQFLGVEKALVDASGWIDNAGPIGDGFARGFGMLHLAIERLPSELTQDALATWRELACRMMRQPWAIGNQGWNNRDGIVGLQRTLAKILQDHAPVTPAEAMQVAQ